jgi:hypothetical protein
LLSDPFIQAYANKALAETRTISRSLSPEGVLNSFGSRLAEAVYERKPWGALSHQRFLETARKTNLDMWQACFPGLANLLAEARQRVRDEEKAKLAAEAEAKKPRNRLLTAYSRYAYIKFCYEIRRGYVSVYVNDIELDRARAAAKDIEGDALKEDKDLDTDSIWKTANEQLRGAFVDRDRCQSALNTLSQQWSTVRPGAGFIQKDF